MQKFILLLTLTAVISAQYAGKIGNGDYMDLMSIDGDHVNREGMIMGDYMYGPIVGASHEEEEDLFSIDGDHVNREGMIMGDYMFGPIVGASHEEQEEELLKIGRLFKKTFSKKNLGKVGKFAGKLALQEAKRRLNPQEDEEELLRIGRFFKKTFSKKNLGKVGKFAGKLALQEAERRLNPQEEEELKFGKFIKKTFSKKNLGKVGKFAAKQAFHEAKRRLNPQEEEELQYMVMELNDNQEMNMICKMNAENKCEGLKEFIAKIRNLIKHKVLRKNMLQKVLNALQTAKEIATALKENADEEDLIMNVCVHQNYGNMYGGIC